MKKLPILILCLLGFFSININAQSCSCTEYVYLNEIPNGGSVHKYSVAPDGTLTEIGNPWYGGSELPRPHGLGTDLNGFLYIGESITDSPDTDIRRLDCDGNILKFRMSPHCKIQLVNFCQNRIVSHL